MKVIFYLLLVFLVVACQSDEADEPELRTKAANGIGLNRAVLQGIVAEVGPLQPIQYGFLCADKSGVNIVSATHKIIIGDAFDAPLEYSVELNELKENTEYFIRAFATNASLTSFYYGNEISFKTSQPSQYLTTLTAEDITSSSALLKGQINNLNELQNVVYGFAWSTNSFSSILDATAVIVGNTNEALFYEKVIAGLQPSTLYYYRSFISNQAGTVIVYGEQKSFTTIN